MIGLSYNFSVPTACVLKEMFIIFPPNPKTKSVIIKWVDVAAKPSMTSVRAYKAEAKIKTILLPKRATRKPATGNDVNKPIGRKSKMPPRAALFNWSFDCKSGILEAQDAKQIPARKKKLLTAIR